MAFAPLSHMLISGFFFNQGFLMVSVRQSNAWRNPGVTPWD
jgi:hypothetical protein